MTGLQLNLRANVAGKGSYSIVARETLIGLWELGVDVVVDPRLAGGASRVDLGGYRTSLLETIGSRTPSQADAQIHVRSLSRPNERELQQFGVHDGARDLVVPGAANLCLFAIDGTRPDPYAQYGPEQAWDVLAVPSTHSARALLTTGVDPARVAVVPQGADTRVFNPGLDPLTLNTEKGFKFLLGSTPWLDRKNIAASFEAYYGTFSASDDVVLVVHSPIKEALRLDDAGAVERVAVTEGIRRVGEETRQRLSGTAEVLFLFEDLSLHDLARLNVACNVLLHPHRAEAFCLTIAEAMACGMATVVTPWGGNADYCSREFNRLLPFTLVDDFRRSELTWAEPEPSPITWAQPSTAALAAHMEELAGDREAARDLGLRAAAEIADNWTWRRAAKRLIEVVDMHLGLDVRRRH